MLLGRVERGGGAGVGLGGGVCFGWGARARAGRPLCPEASGAVSAVVCDCNIITSATLVAMAWQDSTHASDPFPALLA